MEKETLIFSESRHTWPLHRRAWAVLREQGLEGVKSKTAWYWSVARALGACGTVAFLLKERMARLFKWSEYSLYSKQSRWPLICRANSSDRDVFAQMFILREYDCLTEVKPPRLIIDGGANVGYSSAYFLSRYPTAKVLAVEPDTRNFKQLQRNLAPFGERAQLLEAGIWSHRANLVVSIGEYRDGREWATQVRECRFGEKPDVQAVSVGDLLEMSGHDFIDILKLDIEGSEVEVFARNYEKWLDKVGIFVVELHDEECERAFYAAMKELGPVKISQSYEVAVVTTR